MAEANPKSIQKTEDGEEKMEVVETSPESDKVVESTPQDTNDALKGVPAKTGEEAEFDADKNLPELPDQSSVEPGSSDKTGTADEKKTGGFLKSVKKACKSVLTKISPRKQDKAPFVPEAVTGVPAGEPSAVPVACVGKSKPPKGRRGSLVIDSPTSEGRTLITEMSASSEEGDLPEDSTRKASVASTDTAAHIPMISNLEESSLIKETVDETKSSDEENKESGDPDVTMEADDQ